MLSYSDPHKFEQIRSQWESAQTPSKASPTMAGRKDKSAAHAPAPTDTNKNPGPSKFRRKLSHGLSFLSNPLSQRKVTPNRKTSDSSVIGNKANTALDALIRREAERLPRASRVEPSTGSPRQRAVSFESARTDESTTEESTATRIASGTTRGPLTRSPSMIFQLHHRPMSFDSMSTLATSTDESLDHDTTPRALPRSRGMIFRPEHMRSGSPGWMTESESASDVQSLSVKPHEDARATPTKIPTPTSPALERGCSSPRQYVSKLSAQKSKVLTAGSVFATGGADSPSKSSVRSYTTPNLMELRQSSFGTPWRPSMRKLTTGIPLPQRIVMKENNDPKAYRYSQTLSQIKESSPRVEEAESPATPNKRPSGLTGVITHSKQSPATPPSSGKRQGSRVVEQTPLAAQRALRKKPSPRRAVVERPIRKSIILQPRLMGPLNPPTPPTARIVTAQSALPRAITEKELRTRASTMPSTKGMVRQMLSKSQNEMNPEVRNPSSSALDIHRDSPPPVPSIPAQYKSCSMPVLPKTAPFSSRAARRPSILLPKARAQNAYKNTVRKNNQTESINAKIAVSSTLSNAHQNEESNRRPIVDKPLASLGKKRPKLQNPFLQSSSNPLMRLSNLSGMFQDDSSQPVPVAECQEKTDDCANISVLGQVKERMPPIYWAGRFQARFDQWRTQAMQKELDPDFVFVGDLAQYKLSDENEAAAKIFLQLWDKCLSVQAADSLLDFEFEYRLEHDMLGPEFEMLSLKDRKDGGATSGQGHIGRAVRKLTPRKSSFVSLLKGKGWGNSKEEELNTTDRSSECHPQATKSYASLAGQSA